MSNLTADQLELVVRLLKHRHSQVIEWYNALISLCRNSICFFVQSLLLSGLQVIESLVTSTSPAAESFVRDHHVKVALHLCKYVLPEHDRDLKVSLAALTILSAIVSRKECCVTLSGKGVIKLLVKVSFAVVSAHR